MIRGPAGPAEAHELLAYVFDGKPHFLSPSVATWLASSKRFTAFVTTFRDKIRKKIRATHDLDGLLDVRLELEAAYLLLQERSLSLVYEPDQAERGRRPDFAVTFTTSLTFMLEVTRLREGSHLIGERLAEAIYSKLGQMVPSRSNVLFVGIGDLQFAEEDLRFTLQAIRERAERDNPVFLQRRGFRDRGDFFGHFHRLSEILVRGGRSQAGTSVVGWINPQAKHPLPSRVRTALHRGLTR